MLHAGDCRSCIRRMRECRTSVARLSFATSRCWLTATSRFSTSRRFYGSTTATAPGCSRCERSARIHDAPPNVFIDGIDVVVPLAIRRDGSSRRRAGFLQHERFPVTTSRLYGDLC